MDAGGDSDLENAISSASGPLNNLKSAGEGVIASQVSDSSTVISLIRSLNDSFHNFRTTVSLILVYRIISILYLPTVLRLLPNGGGLII